MIALSANDKNTELREKGYCVLRARLPRGAVAACKDAFWPILLEYLENHGHEPNRGPHRHFLPMPFDPPCFAPEFFFDEAVLDVVRTAMSSRVVADQWSCDVPVLGSDYQQFHADYQRPLFEEAPDLSLPPYMLVASFGLVPVTATHGPIEIAVGTHSMPRDAAMRALESGMCKVEPVLLEIGDILIRQPWALHRGTPNQTATPRALLSVRYVRRWYTDHSRNVHAIPSTVWQSLPEGQRAMMRFPVGT